MMVSFLEDKSLSNETLKLLFIIIKIWWGHKCAKTVGSGIESDYWNMEK